ncbi:50S ribosomal protein L2 [Candidatus Woesearchaeota archaeon]|jgi:large subunit ribosomal protein L2|nr:50S ribosomal protein L2 [Candidatus Woesearchaeota archaeon]|tara:strand:+ start:582 stop:1283 length:702 start_codon:yes stop_codon:yes gene_type:complete
MGKNLIQQKRGKGSPTYKVNSFQYLGKASQLSQAKGKVIDIQNSTGHSAPLLLVKYENREKKLVIGVEGIRVGDILEKGEKAKLKTGNSIVLKEIPVGTPICNIEGIPGDGGKFARTSGSVARIVGKTKNGILVKFPSNKQKELNPKCYASIGIVAGGGRTEKPFLKAGNKMKSMKAKGKYWPIVSGASMNAVDHPLGGARSSRKGRPTIAPKNAPPGRKIGMIRPRQTGRNR